MKHILRATPFALALVATLSLAGCSGLIAEGSADYQGYSSVADLSRDADLVVSVTIGDSRNDLLFPSTDGGDDPQENPQAGTDGKNDDVPGIPITVYSATVDEVFAGSAKPGDVIEIKQLGGEQEGTKYVDDSTVPLTTGTSYLLFLATYADSPASILGGTAGQFIPSDDGYRSLNEETPLITTKEELDQLP